VVPRRGLGAARGAGRRGPAQGQKRYTTELIANQVTNLDRRPREEGEGGSAPPFPADARPAGTSPVRREAQADDTPSDLDDLPF
jgi:single-stranded DNA-binding protein